MGDVLLKIGSSTGHLPGNEQDHGSPRAPFTGGGDGISRGLHNIPGTDNRPPSRSAGRPGADGRCRIRGCPHCDWAWPIRRARIRKTIKAADEASGLIITQLRPAGPGALAGLKIGDLITHAGTKQLIAPADIAAITRPTRQVPLLLRVVREGSAGFIAITGEIEP